MDASKSTGMVVTSKDVDRAWLKECLVGEGLQGTLDREGVDLSVQTLGGNLVLVSANGNCKIEEVISTNKAKFVRWFVSCHCQTMGEERCQKQEAGVVMLLRDSSARLV
ncbi:hypothetical protein Ancab_038680 [Ancistrocladus abbreviatus]